MEALLFIFDSVVLVAMIYWGLIDDRRARGVPQRSLFRFVDDPAAAARARKLARGNRSSANVTPKPQAGQAIPRPMSAEAIRRADLVRSRIP